MLGIPAGVKMYSSVFSMNVKHAIDVFDNFCGNQVTLKDAGVDITDIFSNPTFFIILAESC